jgi:hypothetical protein
MVFAIVRARPSAFTQSKMIGMLSAARFVSSSSVAGRAVPVFADAYGASASSSDGVLRMLMFGKPVSGPGPCLF